jgi:dienelactone hydrolase
MLRLWLFIALWLVSASTLLAQQDFSPPPANQPSEAALKEIREKTDKLAKWLAELRRLGVHDPVLAEVEIYHKAAAWIVRHNEFYHKNSGEWTLAVLDRGLLRASQAFQGESPWLQISGRTVERAYRSRIDGSVQPYAVTLPADYGRDRRKKWRVDIVLHGRDTSLTEAKFLYQHGQGKAAPKGDDFVRLDIYGRGNNAYRWAGEADVLEAIENFQAVEQMLGRAALLDPSRVVLRGFSMGGAGSWHLGLHYPDRWCVIGPGAGFSTTHGYIGGLPEKLPDYQEKCLRIYDAVDYAENAFNVPIVAYAGENDPQLQAARNIEAKLKPLGIKTMKLLVAPGLKHQFPAEWQQKAEEEYALHAGRGRGREEYPNHIRFVTYTLRYPSCSWVEIIGLDRHYEQAKVDAEKTGTGFVVKTANVRALHLRMPDFDTAQKVTVQIDGAEQRVRPYRAGNGAMNIYLEKSGDTWHSVLPQKLVVDRMRRVQKTAGLQGPIDDAFNGPFLCVRGTGKTWHDATGKHVEAELKRFQDEWHKYLRGELAVKDDEEVTEEDIAGKHLILFGDPNSNSLIAQILNRLPLKWTKESIELGGKTYTSADHVPVLIYPSPLNSARYVVLNSGHTFHAADFKGTNALLYPRLGDYAVLKVTEKDASPAVAGIFDEFWRVPKD